MKSYFLLGSVVCFFFVVLGIYTNWYSNVFVFIWGASLVLFLGAFLPLHKVRRWRSLKKYIPHRNVVIAFFVIIAIPALVRIALYDSTRIHGDDMVTGYFSANYDLIRTHFFSEVPSEKVEWVTQFPTLFFVLQKGFFILFGLNVLTVKLSVIPYVLVVSAVVFLIARRMWNTESAVISVILYAFLAISLYHETLGLHFISSTAVFMLFVYVLILYGESQKTAYAVGAGILTGFCYLFYTSSYIALPFLAIVFIGFAVYYRKKRLSILKDFLYALIAFFLVLGPFITYMIRFDAYYLFERTNQVSLLTGEWSGQANDIRDGKQTVPQVLLDNAEKAGLSLYQNDRGGHGGYSFGNLAFFDLFTFFLFLVGVCSSIYLVFWKKQWILGLVLFAMCVSYVGGVILTIPPPAYHRASISFPFIAIITASFFHLLLSLKHDTYMLRYLIVLVLLFMYGFYNYRHFIQATQSENNNVHYQLARYIHDHFPEKPVYVSSFPGFTFQKVLYFVDNGSKRAVHTDYHRNILDQINERENALHVVAFPRDFKEQYRAKYRNAQLIEFSEEYMLLVN